MKILKNVLIIVLILTIKGIVNIYKIISKFWIKYNSGIKNFIINLDKVLRTQLQ